jgi:hypothetical protein
MWVSECVPFLWINKPADQLRGSQIIIEEDRLVVVERVIDETYISSRIEE